MLTEVLTQLCSQTKLERDKGAAHLHRLLPTVTSDERIQLEENLLQLLNGTGDIPWETKQGSLLGAKSVIPFINTENEKEAEFLQHLKEVARRLLTDTEVRVRLEAGEVLGALCGKMGIDVYKEEKDYILSLIKTNLERQPSNDESSRQEQIEREKLVEKLAGSSGRRDSADAAQIFHDTAGWKNLETSLKCLQFMVSGCGTNFQPFVDQELLVLIFQTLTHTNRFVRETGFYVCSALVSCGNTENDTEGRDSVCEINPIFAYGHEFSKHLALGLADNWSQVRLAASDATRHFLMSLPNNRAREVFFPQLLPQMCLNRYYVADGVRIYSQETWRQVTGSNGRSLVQRYIERTVEYYICTTESNNHAVREAACACIAELASKIDKETVRPYVHTLLDTLLRCFQDDSWPVRDAACLACGHFVLCFPEESQPSMNELYTLFFKNLGDPISSVRQGAAASLANVVRAYHTPALQIVIEHIKTDLSGIKEQTAELDKYEANDCGEQAQFGVIKRLRDNDFELHSNKQMYSCGSLAPKMGRGGGCSDHKFRRDSQPWEKADGCVYLLSELSNISEASRVIQQCLPAVADACIHRHYAQHVVFLETVCKQLPIIAKHIGVKPFKAYFDLFIDPIFQALECENALTSSAASQCLNQLGPIIGPNILRARVSNHNPQYLQHLDANVFIAPF